MSGREMGIPEPTRLGSDLVDAAAARCSSDEEFVCFLNGAVGATGCLLSVLGVSDETLSAYLMLMRNSAVQEWDRRVFLAAQTQGNA